MVGESGGVEGFFFVGMVLFSMYYWVIRSFSATIWIMIIDMYDAEEGWCSGWQYGERGGEERGLEMVSEVFILSVLDRRPNHTFILLLFLPEHIQLRI